MSELDPKALEVAMIAYRTADYDRAHAPGPLQDVSVSVRTAIEAYLTATSSAATARIARLEEALRETKFFLLMMDGASRSTGIGFVSVNVPSADLAALRKQVLEALGSDAV